MSSSQTKRYSVSEEIFHSVSHGIGIILSLIGFGVMLAVSILWGNAKSVVSMVIYCFSLISMYLSSTLYHALPFPLSKRVFRILDHCAIYLLIAGTYTPFMLVSLEGRLGWTIFGVIWAAAIIGIVLNAVNLTKYAKISVLCYVAMGWAIVFCLRPLLAALDFGGIVLLVIGGIFYTVGVIFYKLRVPFMHGIWHLFVLSGSAFHYFSILLYVLPSAATA